MVCGIINADYGGVFIYKSDDSVLNRKLFKIENKIMGKKVLDPTDLDFLINYVLSAASLDNSLPHYRILYLENTNNQREDMIAYTVYKNIHDLEIVINGSQYFHLNMLKAETKFTIAYIFIDAMLHEFWHVKQFNQVNASIGKGVFDKEDYQLLNNLLVSDCFPDFYKKYHDFFECEIDANVNAVKVFLSNLQNPVFRLYEKNIKTFTDNISNFEKNRLDSKYDLVFDQLNYIDFDNCKSKLLSKFSLLEYYFLKDYPIAQLLESKDSFIEQLTEQMICKRDFQNDISKVKATQDFFDYLIVKRIEEHPNPEDLFLNVRLDTAFRIKNILNSNQKEVKVLKKSRN